MNGMDGTDRETIININSEQRRLDRSRSAVNTLTGLLDRLTQFRVNSLNKRKIRASDSDEAEQGEKQKLKQKNEGTDTEEM
jgi:hypothetical protein